ncbi:MAG: TrkA family potassium uptake protein [Clostridiaceae bacterium]|jgi:trk system potassium uptake protein TrkA|nr:TrkA family potassium uptake protein [Eubacteriales bacterium]NLV47036.1 TrkA family potassium uptake protein [Clostridiaceae bacterium]
MRIFIIGGGKLAYYLIKTLHAGQHEITVVEQEKDVGERIASDFEDVSVYDGDGTSIRLLESINCSQADFYIAVTGKDENNLVGCQIAKRHFNVKRTIARVNNPKNIEMFHLLGVDRVYSSTQILASIIEQEIEFSGMRTVFSIEKTTKELIEFRLSPKSDAAGRTLLQYKFPGNSKVVLITREDGTVEMPRGDLMMHGQDIMLMVCDQAEQETIWKKMVR